MTNCSRCLHSRPAAALRYAERNIAEGKCCVCPKPLDRNSVRYCTEHLAKTRARDQQKKALSVPGSREYLYAGEAPSTHGRQPGTLASLEMEREKRTRAVLAELGIPPESNPAVTINAAKEALLRVMPNSKEKGMTRDELFAMVTIPAKGTGQKALERLVAEGKVQRIGKGITGDPYLYWKADDLDRTKRELASQHAIENAGRHLRGGR